MTKYNISNVIYKKITDKPNYSKKEEAKPEIFWAKVNAVAEVVYE